MAISMGYSPISLAWMFGGIGLACLLRYALIGFVGSATKRLFSKALTSALSILCSLMILGFAAILSSIGDYPCSYELPALVERRSKSW